MHITEEGALKIRDAVRKGDWKEGEVRRIEGLGALYISLDENAHSSESGVKFIRIGSVSVDEQKIFLYYRRVVDKTTDK